MKKLFATLVMGLALSGCATLDRAYDAVTGVKVSTEAVVVASSTFNILQATATNYLSLKRCTTTSGPICRRSEATQPIKLAVQSGRIARDNLQKFLRDHPGELGPGGLYDALIASTDALKNIYATYNVEAAVTGGAK